MVNLELTKEEFEYLELILHNHEYEENERHLIDSLEYKFYKTNPDNKIKKNIIKSQKQINHRSETVVDV